MKKYIKASTSTQQAGDLLFNLMYNLCKDKAGINPAGLKAMSRSEYDDIFDLRFADDVENIIINVLGKHFDISMHEVDIIVEAILDKAETDIYFSYKKHDQYDEIIDEWYLPVEGE